MTYSEGEIRRQLSLGEDSHWEFQGNRVRPAATQGVRSAMIWRLRSQRSPMRAAACCSAVSPTQARRRACLVNRLSSWILFWSR